MIKLSCDIKGKRAWDIIKMRVKNYKLTDKDLDLNNHNLIKHTSNYKTAMYITYELEQLIKNNR